MRKKIIILAILILFGTRLGIAQPSPKQTVREIKFAFTHDIKLLTDDFYFKTYISLSSYEEGFFAPSQSAQLLDDYLSTLPKFKFVISNYSAKGVLAYLSAKLVFGNQQFDNTKNIFVTLKYIEGNWQITQVTLN